MTKHSPIFTMTDHNPTVKDRDNMYRLIISQLFYDGYQNIAVNLAAAVKAYPACSPSDRLLKVVQIGSKEEEEQNDAKKMKQSLGLPGSGIDLEFETDIKSISPDASHYETIFVTSHKLPCRTGIFHPRGNMIATGSEDAAIKILDVDRILQKAEEEDAERERPTKEHMEVHPVVRTLYDHQLEITAMDFHPYITLLASGSLDKTIKLFDYQRSSTKKAQKSIQEAAEIRTLKFHPTGDWLLVGTDHPTVRMYDAATMTCYVGSNAEDQHKKEITCVRWSPNSRLFVTCSKDGDIKIWDGVSNKCVCTFVGAHGGAEVVSVTFSRNSKYVLSSGMDSMVKLWELSTSRCLIAYTGAGSTGAMTTKTNAVFNHTEDYVLFPDEKTTSLCCWDSRNAERQPLLSLSHNKVVTSISHSPIAPAFMTCSDDNRMRFWYRKGGTEFI